MTSTAAAAAPTSSLTVSGKSRPTAIATLLAVNVLKPGAVTVTV